MGVGGHVWQRRIFHLKIVGENPKQKCIENRIPSVKPSSIRYGKSCEGSGKHFPVISTCETCKALKTISSQIPTHDKEDSHK